MKENLLKKRKKKGFTLIELIVVIAIIAIIALIAIPKVMGYQDDAKKKADIANAKTIANTAATLITKGDISTGTAYSIEIKSGYDEVTPPATTKEGVGYLIANSLQSIPTMQYSTNNKRSFWVSIDKDGNVKVYNTTSDSKQGTDQVYPDVGSGTYHQ